MLPNAKNTFKTAQQITAALYDKNPKGAKYKIVGGGYRKPTFTISSVNIL